MKRIDHLMVVWICISCSIQAEEISNVKYKYFSQGETVLLTCKTDVNNVVWHGPADRKSFGSSPINGTDVYGRPIVWHTSLYTTDKMVNPNLTHQNRLTIVDRTHMGGGFNLQIRNISRSDQGLYICHYTYNKSFSSLRFVLQQKMLPSKIMFSNETKEHILNGIENSTMIIICSVKSGKPPETLLLRRNNKILKNGTYGRIEFTFKATKLDHNVKFTCEANSSLLKIPLKRNVHINIKYKPFVAIMDSMTLYTSEGSEKNMCCEVDSNPAPILTRLINGSKDIFVKHNVQNICYQIDIVSRYDQGNYTCIAENEIGSSSTTIFLKVKFPPDIHINYKNFTIHDELRKIQCKPEGKPTNYTYGVWEHQSEFNEHIRYLNSTDNGTLILPKVTEASEEYQDSGIYICKATNGVPNEQHFQQGKAYVVSQGPPVFVYQNSAIQYGITNKRVNIRVYILSYSKIECKAIKAIDGLVDDNYVLNTYTKHLKVIDIFHGKTISVNGIEVEFVFARLEHKRFRMYRITVCNTFGNASYTLSLVPKADNSAEELIISSERTVIVVLLTLIVFLLVLMGLYVRYLKKRYRKRRITPTTSQIADSAHYMEITEDNNVLSTLQENNNPIISTADINVVECRNIDLILEQSSSASSDDDNIASEHVDDGYEKPYTTLLVLNQVDNTHDYLATDREPSNENPAIFATDAFGTTSMYDTKTHDHPNARYENVNLKSDENKAEYINLSLK